MEIQCSRDEDFAERMAIYRSRLHDRFAMPIISIALLADPGLRWRPDKFQDEHDGCGMTVHFRIIKLMDFRDQLGQLATSGNMTALAAAAHLLALQTRRSVERRRAAKQRLLHQIFAGSWNVRELSDLRQIIDLMMQLPRTWQTEAAMDIYDLYEADQQADKDSFAYIFWELTDRRGRIKGRAEGLAEGQAEAQAKARQHLAALVERQLMTRFGSLPATIRSTVADASEEQLEQLALAMLRVRTLDDALVIAGLIA